MWNRLPPPLRRWLYAGGTRRDRLRNPRGVVQALGVEAGAIVADLGPGAGHFTLELARAVAPNGRVYALEAHAGRLEELRRLAEQRGLTTLRTVLVDRDRLSIPEPVDLLFVAATYHHLPNQTAYFGAARAFLRPGAHVAILESRREGLLARWLGFHATPPRRIRDEMERAGFELKTTLDVVYGYWFGVFEVAGGHPSSG
jgi:predicted methyltransferase